MPTKKTESAKPAPAKKTPAKTAAKPAAVKKAAAKPAAKAAAARKTVAKAPAAKTAKPAAASKTAAVAPAAEAAAKAKPSRPAPARVPGRKERRGVVVSSAMDKTIVVRIDVSQKHDTYSKIVRRSSKLHVHDEHNVAGVGDLVRVVETRPLSAMKRWRLLEVLERAK